MQLANLTCSSQADDNAILQVLFDGGQVGNLKTEVFSAYFPEVNLGVFPAPQALVLCWLTCVPMMLLQTMAFLSMHCEACRSPMMLLHESMNFEALLAKFALARCALSKQ
jgi:hypothetical protein